LVRAVFLSFLLCVACKSDETVESAPPPAACTCEASEDCKACYEHIGECCYADTTIGGRVELMIANCQRDGRCSSCCNECVAKSCDELLAGHLCPNGQIAQ
jgi:hypothetical protein